MMEASSSTATPASSESEILFGRQFYPVDDDLLSDPEADPFDKPKKDVRKPASHIFSSPYYPPSPARPLAMHHYGYYHHNPYSYHHSTYGEAAAVVVAPPSLYQQVQQQKKSKYTTSTMEVPQQEPTTNIARKQNCNTIRTRVKTIHRHDTASTGEHQEVLSSSSFH